MKAVDQKKAKKKAANKKAAQQAKEKAAPKVLTNAEKITRLETSLRRQINRANQVAKSDLEKKLKQLKPDEASDAEIAAIKVNSAVALQKKIETIETRVKARIEKLKKQAKNKK